MLDRKIGKKAKFMKFLKVSIPSAATQDALISLYILVIHIMVLSYPNISTKMLELKNACTLKPYFLHCPILYRGIHDTHVMILHVVQVKKYWRIQSGHNVFHST